jgi:hypothetical protein
LRLADRDFTDAAGGDGEPEPDRVHAGGSTASAFSIREADPLHHHSGGRCLAAACCVQHRMLVPAFDAVWANSFDTIFNLQTGCSRRGGRFRWRARARSIGWRQQHG